MERLPREVNDDPQQALLRSDPESAKPKSGSAIPMHRDDTDLVQLTVTAWKSAEGKAPPHWDETPINGGSVEVDIASLEAMARALNMSEPGFVA